MLENHPKAKGERSEAIVLAEFVRRGVSVLTPFGDNQRYDLVLDMDGRFIRVQVKTARRTGTGAVKFETRSNGETKREVRKPYHGDADIFAVYSPDTAGVYVVPVEKTGTACMSLRVNDPVNSNPNINWADEYTLDAWLDSVK